MKPTPLRLLQILHKSALKEATNHRVLPAITTLIQEAKRNPAPTVIQLLEKQRESQTDVQAVETETSGVVPKISGEWPANLRIEPTVKKADLKNVDARIRVRLKELIKRET
ncbi:hypothetical protein VNI00_000623 [Paramarasmius palmivorus]|uniref:Uncharacterized protein n=1 Tax=Paramarasmius palmivorus TaxID=297713 RepID=A0AAW0E9P4_9AGAR